MDQTAVDPAASLTSVNRRGLLLGIGVTAMSAAMGLGAAAAVRAASDAPSPAAFITASRFVTGAPLDDGAALDRAWTQLRALDADFPRAVDRLADALRRSGAATMTAFMGSPVAKDAALLKTATTIVSAFYLGYTGTPVEHRMKDNTGFVTFVGALMWRPTLDATIIPTFARGGTDYWVKPPAGTPVPPGPQGRPEWQGSTSSSTSPKA